MDFKHFFLILILLLNVDLFAENELPSVDEDADLIKAKGQIERMNQEDSSILQRHNPFYFGYGSPDSKLQFSFKTPIVRDFPLYFGYTQLMFWELEEDSKPFKDVTYNPELFYRWNIKDWGALKKMDFGLWSHNSNGKPEPDSRSLEKQYIRIFLEHEFDYFVVISSVHVAFAHTFDKGNEDIQDYVGPLGINISFIQLFKWWVDKSELSFQANPGGKFADKWEKGGYQVSWSFRLGGIDVVPAFYVQYYTGYAETLLNYNKKSEEVRVGFIF